MELTDVKKLNVSKKCANPGNLHSKERKGLKNVPEAAAKHFNLTVHHKLCVHCYQWINKEKALESVSTEMEFEDNELDDENAEEVFERSDSGTSTKSLAADFGLCELNSSLITLGESPVKKQKLSSEKYTSMKFSKAKENLKKKISVASGGKDVRDEIEELAISEREELEEYREMIRKLKEKFHHPETKKSSKVQLLTVLPTTWSERKIAIEFNCSRRMASAAKNLVEEKGILSLPNPKQGKKLPEETNQLVSQFYLNSDVSREMPGQKDYVSVYNPVTQQREHKQKHLLLMNLKEAHIMFKEKHPNVKVGFSKFSEYRPKEVVIAGQAGTHSVCVCIIHQNMKLMYDGSKLEKFVNIVKVREFLLLNSMLCEEKTDKCHLFECDKCGNTTTLKNALEDIFEENFIDNITFQKWTGQDRATMEKKYVSTEEFIEEFCESSRRFLMHDFLTKKQSSFLQEKKSSLEKNEAIVILDFSENYKSQIQDEIQSFHWNSIMTTIHPFVIYYKDQESGDLKHKNFVIISENNEHNSAAVHLFLKYLNDFIKNELDFIKVINYFSDGCAAQYKNCKNFLNLANHEKDFRVKAIWNFFASCHGKGPADGLGGTIKRLARKASLQRLSDNFILTSKDLYEFAKENIPNIIFKFVTNQDHENELEIFSERYSQAKTISGTLKIHYVEPFSENTVKIKRFSACQNFAISKVTSEEEQIADSDINNFVAINYDGKWYAAYVLEKNNSMKEAKISCLHPCGPNPSFYYPSLPDIFILRYADIIKKIDLNTVNGRTYTIQKKEMLKVSKAHQEMLQRK